MIFILLYVESAIICNYSSSFLGEMEEIAFCSSSSNYWRLKIVPFLNVCWQDTETQAGRRKLWYELHPDWAWDSVWLFRVLTDYNILQSKTGIKSLKLFCPPCSCSLTCYSCMVNGRLWYNDSNMIWYDPQFPQNFSNFHHFFNFLRWLAPVYQTGWAQSDNCDTNLCEIAYNHFYLEYSYCTTTADSIQIVLHREKGIESLQCQW